MDLQLQPETESRLQELVNRTGRPAGDLVDDAMAGYLEELAEARHSLDTRYDDVKSGVVVPVEGEEAFARLRRKSEDRRARP